MFLSTADMSAHSSSGQSLGTQVPNVTVIGLYTYSHKGVPSELLQGVSACDTVCYVSLFWTAIQAPLSCSKLLGTPSVADVLA